MPHSTISIPVSEDRVLLAMEDDASADLLGHRMTRRGIHPDRAEHGAEAMEQLREMPYDLVVIETRLSGLTGLELVRRLPSDEVLADPQVVLLGQGGNNEEIIRAFELGAAEYIERPFAPEVALARIVRFLEQGRNLVSRPPESTGILPIIPVAGESIIGEPVLPFQIMIGITAVLVVFAAILATIALASHFRAKRRSRRRSGVRKKWKTMLLDMLAGDTSPKDIIAEVEESEERLFLEFLAPYAVTIEGRSQELLTYLATPFLTRLEQDLQSWRLGTRARAVQLFGLLGDESSRGPLRRSLDDPSLFVSYTAFRWLARRGNREDAHMLLARLDRLSDVDVNQLSSALVHLGEEAQGVLRSYLEDDSQTTFVRVVCAETLRWMGDTDAAPLAAQLLVYEPHPELTAALLRLLRRVGRPEHAPLVRSYCTGEKFFVCIHAARALGQIGHPDHDRNLLRRLVTDTDSRWIALNAAKSLKELGQTTPLHHISRTTHKRASLAENVLKEPQR